ncbi:hypothetical protein ORJ04_02180 [Rheinheimera baltica]|uniref:Uncharacterized protein n=1 Tax=Rheinheimera baltica TaxID=67576 RepID=A0ABT9HUE1_9GAMM|nr:hypothetical protein [Rheinheimera baltica]MDP5134753.1 hypothetical protein [Rheinheimera baltica]
MTNPTFDMQAAIQALRDGKGLSGKDGILTPDHSQQFKLKNTYTPPLF